jgi:hypothetical protein
MGYALLPGQQPIDVRRDFVGGAKMIEYGVFADWQVTGIENL